MAVILIISHHFTHCFHPFYHCSRSFDGQLPSKKVHTMVKAHDMGFTIVQFLQGSMSYQPHVEQTSLRWNQMSISNQLQLHCLFNSLITTRNVKTPHRWPFVKGIYKWIPQQSAKNMESISKTWCHHVLRNTPWHLPQGLIFSWYFSFISYSSIIRRFKFWVQIGQLVCTTSMELTKLQ